MYYMLVYYYYMLCHIGFILSTYDLSLSVSDVRVCAVPQRSATGSPATPTRDDVDSVAGSDSWTAAHQPPPPPPAQYYGPSWRYGSVSPVYTQGTWPEYPGQTPVHFAMAAYGGYGYTAPAGTEYGYPTTAAAERIPLPPGPAPPPPPPPPPPPATPAWRKEIRESSAAQAAATANTDAQLAEMREAMVTMQHMLIAQSSVPPVPAQETTFRVPDRPRTGVEGFPATYSTVPGAPEAATWQAPPGRSLTGMEGQGYSA